MTKGSLENRIMNGTTTADDAIAYKVLKAVALRNLMPLVVAIIGGIILGIAIGGLLL